MIFLLPLSVLPTYLYVSVMSEVRETEPVDVDVEVGGQYREGKEEAEVLVVFDIVEQIHPRVGHELRDHDGVEEDQGGDSG